MMRVRRPSRFRQQMLTYDVYEMVVLGRNNTLEEFRDSLDIYQFTILLVRAIYIMSSDIEV